MNIIIPDTARKLADIFDKNKTPLYVVGGYVRNWFLGVKGDCDVDLCSKATPEKVAEMLKGTEFKVRVLDDLTGVVMISNEKHQFEHATFRKEIYDVPGIHKPTYVEFVDDLNVDADRRDFTINSMYYDITSGEVIDPFGGQKDIEEHTMRTITRPQYVFSNDGIRLLRLIRFACTLGLDIEEETFYEACKNVHRLKFISKEMIRDEFSRIIQADIEYPSLPFTSDGHSRGMLLLGEMGAWPYIIPQMEELRQSAYTMKGGLRVYEYVAKVVEKSPPEIRLSALLHLIGVPSTLQFQSNIKNQQIQGTELLPEILGPSGLCYPKEVLKRVQTIIYNQNFDKHGFASERKRRLFAFEIHEVLELYCMFRDSITQAQTKGKKHCMPMVALKKSWDKMQEDNVPLFIADLKIKAVDVLKLYPDLKPQALSRVLKAVWTECIVNPKLNETKNSCLYVLNKIMQKR